MNTHFLHQTESDELSGEMLESDVDANEQKIHLGIEPVRTADVTIEQRQT